MHTGVISFCDRIAFNIKSTDVKDILLHELHARFNVRILQRHWFRLDETNREHLARSPHWMMLRSNGNPYYMYFTYYEDVPQVMFIDKKVQPGYEKPRILLVRGQFDEALFSGTLLEGEMVKDELGQWIFLINDVLGYEGKTLEKMELPDRLNYAYRLLQQDYRADPLMDVCQFQVKKTFPAIQAHWEDLLAFSQSLPYTNRGVYLWPFSLKYKPKLMNFDDSLIKKVIRKVKDDPLFRESKDIPTKEADPTETHTELNESSFRPEDMTRAPDPTPSAPLHSSQPPPPPPPRVNDRNEALERSLYLRKTENPDVYLVFAEENAKTKMGVAHIPSLALSKQIRAIFKDLNVVSSVRLNCRYDATFQKWVPISP